MRDALLSSSPATYNKSINAKARQTAKEAANSTRGLHVRRQPKSAQERQGANPRRGAVLEGSISSDFRSTLKNGAQKYVVHEAQRFTVEARVRSIASCGSQQLIPVQISSCCDDDGWLGAHACPSQPTRC